MSADYVDYQVASLPGWLAGPRALAWALVLGVAKEGLAQAAKAAVKARFASTSPPDGLVEIARDRGVDAGLRETQGSLRRRIAQSWEQWGMSGTRDGLFRAFELDGLVNAQVLDHADLAELRWYEFVVRIDPPFPWPGSTVDDIPDEWVARLVGLIRKWKPAHATCLRLEIRCFSETWAQRHARRATWGATPLEPWGARRLVIHDIR